MAKSYQQNAGFILPDSKALDGLMQNIDYNRKMGLLNVKAKQDYHTQLNKDFRDNQLKAKQGILWQPTLNKLSQQWTDMGAQLKADGINPWNDSTGDPRVKQFTDLQNRINGIAEVRDLHQKNLLDASEQYAKGGVDEDSYMALQDLYKNTDAEKIYDSGMMPPSLMKAFDVNEALGKIEAPTVEYNTIKGNLETKTKAANQGAIRMNVESAVAQNPGWKRTFDKENGIQRSSAPAKDILGTLDPLEIDGYLHQYYTTTKEGANEFLKSLGDNKDTFIKSLPQGDPAAIQKTPEYNKFKNDAISRQLKMEERYQNGMQNLSQQKVNEVNKSILKSYNFDLENQGMKRRDQQLQEEAAARARESQGWQRTDRKLKDAGANERDHFIQGLQVGNGPEVMKLRQLATSRGGGITYTKAGNLVVSYEKKVDGVTKKVSETIDLSPENENGYTHLNEILTKMTGKKVDIEALTAKPAYDGALVDAGNNGATKSQIEFFRESFKDDYKSLGDFLYKQGGFKSFTEAYVKAKEILDKKGRKVGPTKK